MLAWNWFQTSLLQAAGAITGSRELVRRPGFPAAILPAVTVTIRLLDFVLALPILLLVLVMSGSHLRTRTPGSPHCHALSICADA